MKTPEGQVLTAPEDWELLLPGDAALTRRVKAAGEHWVVAEKKGRKVFSRGVWAAAEHIERIRRDLEVERSNESFAKKKQAAAKRREIVQNVYVEDFQKAILAFLAFPPQHSSLACELAVAVARHATPVGSGTVARTQRIPIEKRAEAAVIAWMRHQTTAYDEMHVPNIRGERRSVRRILADGSKQLLDRYRRGETVGSDCPLQIAFRQIVVP